MRRAREDSNVFRTADKPESDFRMAKFFCSDRVTINFEIMTCAQNLIEERRIGKQISIYVDSQAAIADRENSVFEFRLTQVCANGLDKLGLIIGNNLALVWVAGHSGIRGNEIEF